MSNHTMSPRESAVAVTIIVFLVGLTAWLAVFGTITAKETGMAEHIIGATGAWLMLAFWFVAISDALIEARIENRRK